MSKLKLQKLLTQRLRLQSPHFRLESEGGMVFGSVISPTFKGMDDYRRVKSIRDALDTTLGRGARDVGTILAYTPEEWDFTAPAVVTRPAVQRNGRGTVRHGRTRAAART